MLRYLHADQLYRYPRLAHGMTGPGNFAIV